MNFARKIFFEPRISYEKCSEIFPEFFEPLFCGSEKIPWKFPPNFPLNFPNSLRKIKKNSPTSFCRSAGRTISVGFLTRITGKKAKVRANFSKSSRERGGFWYFGILGGFWGLYFGYDSGVKFRGEKQQKHKRYPAGEPPAKQSLRYALFFQGTPNINYSKHNPDWLFEKFIYVFFLPPSFCQKSPRFDRLILASFG